MSETILPEMAEALAEARVQNLLKEIEGLKRQVWHAGNLLAVLHGDGGHHIDRVGWEQACLDGRSVYHKLLRARAVVDAARALRDSGYDGPWIGEVCEPLYRAVAEWDWEEER